ncbi:MAG: sugar ABC transporter permease [Oscillospiraceae bacterium]|nr:sugar ABC transporter permease [Oscillospiraceae bacterium]
MLKLTRKQKHSENAIKEERAAYLFLIPAFLGLSLITYIPLLTTFIMGFFNLNVGHLVQNSPLGSPEFVGLNNFVDIFENPSIDFLNSITVTVTYALMAVFASIVYSFFIAVLLNRKIPARGFFRAVFYVPYVLPAAASMVTWYFLFNYDGGIINYLLVQMGFDKSYFMSSSDTVMQSLTMIAVWSCGNLIVIFLAGLQNVPKVYHEAADIDGANFIKRFIHITIPCMTPIIFYNMLMSLVINIQVVIPALAITKGGPGKSTMFMSYLMYQIGFRGRELGKAGAIAFIFFIVAAILAFILFATSKAWIFYEGKDERR